MSCNSFIRKKKKETNVLQFDVQEQNEVAEDRLELFPSPVCV